MADFQISRAIWGDPLAQDGFRSIHDMRRAAPGHYWAKANNARLVAYILSQGLPAQNLNSAAEKIGFSGTPSIAIGEAFQREASLALELIIKSVIAEKIQTRNCLSGLSAVPMTHDVVRLWKQAGLPDLSNADWRQLHHVKRLLYWAARYAAPSNDERYGKEEKEIAVYPVESEGRSLADRIRSGDVPVLDWQTFDRFYEMAMNEIKRISGDGVLFG